LITSGKQIIDNFSRIKVSEKTNNNNEKIGVSSIGSTEDSIKSNTSSNSTHNNNSLDITPIQIKTKPLNNDKYIYNKFSQFQNNINNETIRDLTKIKDNNNEKVVIKGKVEFDSSLEPSKTKFVSKSTANKESTSHSKAMTNYLGHNIPKCGHSSTSSQLAFTTTVEKIGNISTIALKYSYDDIKAFEKLVQIMVNNKYHFKTYSSNDLLFHKKWSLVSEAMKRNDYIEWTPQKCRDSFMGSINWYKKVFNKSFESFFYLKLSIFDSILQMFFQILENAPNYKIASGIYPLFELIHSLNLKYFLKPENFDRVSKLRESFKIKNSQYLETELKIAGKLITEPKFDVNSNPTKNQTYASVLASTSNNTECHQYNDSYNYKTKYFYPNNWVDPHLYQKTSKLMDSDVKEFDLLGKIADKIAAKFGRNIKNFWQIVSDEMLLKGYQSFNADKCRNKFENYVNDYYSLVFIKKKEQK
jgi:hypothetical protein